MAEFDGFRHISVASDDDDVVIHAGVSEKPSDGFGVEGFSSEPETFAVDPSDSPSDGDARIRDAERLVGTGDKGSSFCKDDGYRETTLDDLTPEPMAKTQKIVIICALVALVAAVSYYLFFMR